MNADLQLAGRSERTRKHYIGCAKLFVKHFMRSPEQLGEKEVREYLLSLMTRVRAGDLSIGRYLQYLGALKFLFKVTLRQPDVVAWIPWPKMPKKRPDVMTREEVRRVLDAASTPFWTAFLTTAYAAGLRRMEVAALVVRDVDAPAGILRVARGKGGKAREVMLDPELLACLRAHWRAQGLTGVLLFPARNRGGGWKQHPVELGQATRAFADALRTAGIGRRLTLHSLRHAFATHLLEDGVDIFTLQQLLGHESLETTAQYTLIRTDRIRATASPLRKLRP
ncbi:MAG: tyrosine-type recombinase/integrase [Deltaproteobacteria bacterium]|nr:tyrosine-type recombinase/integrase [Deltaproteobacteria bacterium]